MRKILVIARREYLAMVATKSFIISLTMMPILMLAGIIVPRLLEGQVDLGDRTIVVIDRTGQLVAPLKTAAESYNKTQTKDPKTNKQKSARFIIQSGNAEADDNYRLELSNQIRAGELYAFVEIPADVLKQPGLQDTPPKATYYAANPALSDVKRWVQQSLRMIVQTYRLQKAGIDPITVARSNLLDISSSGLFKETAEGKISSDKSKSEIAAIMTPLVTMMMMFMVVMMSVQPMLESVLEEKSMRIAEVLLGSLNPFQIMAGKLLGNVAASLTIVSIYLAGGFFIAQYNGVTHLIPFRIVPWFICFQILAVFLFGSVFLAIGASVSNLKEAQGLLLPVWLMMTLPMALWFNIVREPTGSFATTMSFIPPFTPMLMPIRLGASEAIPIWQPLVGLILLVLTTLACLYMAGRIFRIGILIQGRTPKLTEIIRWAFSSS